jgi:predicted  nucleic acid-binding Zn-ribbon protein
MTHDPQHTCTKRQDAELRIHTDELRRQDAELVRHCTSFDDLFNTVTRLASALANLTERQDAAIADLQVADGYAQAATERLAREIEELRERVAALEAAPAGVSYVILGPVRDDADQDDDDPDPMEDV